MREFADRDFLETLEGLGYLGYLVDRLLLAPHPLHRYLYILEDLGYLEYLEYLDNLEDPDPQ